MSDALDRLLTEHQCEERYRFRFETGENVVYECVVEGQPVLVCRSNLGAAAAAAGFEALVAIGCTDFVAVGSSGGLIPDLPPGTVVVPDDAIRDEGVSYHYAPAAPTARFSTDIQPHVRRAFESDYRVAVGTIWTTDAFYRETRAKVAQRVVEGALAVDMEASALAAVAEFRGVRLGYAVYMADTLHSDEWDPTELVERNTDSRDGLLRTAVRACASL